MPIYELKELKQESEDIVIYEDAKALWEDIAEKYRDEPDLYIEAKFDKDEYEHYIHKLAEDNIPYGIDTLSVARDMIKELSDDALDSKKLDVTISFPEAYQMWNLIDSFINQYEKEILSNKTAGINTIKYFKRLFDATDTL